MFSSTAPVRPASQPKVDVSTKQHVILGTSPQIFHKHNKTRNELEKLIFNIMFYAPVLEFPASDDIQILAGQA